MSRLVCIGLGYTARALADRMRADGWHVAGTARAAEGARRIAASCDAPIVFDGARPSPALEAAIATATHVLASAPPGEGGDPILAQHGAALRSSPSLAWAGYLSTVGVYGDHQGAWVDETTTPHPLSERGRRRLAAEQAWLALGAASGKRVQVFRLPGIYGPGRSAIDSLRDGSARRLVKPGQVFNRVHVADIATALVAAMRGRGRQAVYNVCDDEPAPPQDVIAYAAGLVGVVPPPEQPFDGAALSPMAASFYAENKRVGNALMKADLGVTLRYPTYREGLASIAAG